MAKANDDILKQEFFQKEREYSIAAEKAKSDDIAELEEAAIMFDKLSEHRDSKERKIKCLEKIDNIKAEEKRRRKLILIAVIPVILLILCFVFLYRGIFL